MNHKKIKVLIVDDEELARKMIISGLDWNGMDMEIVGEAVSGMDALAIMEEQIPDILFTDIKMPYMSGLDLSRMVARRYPHMKIVILTAFKDFEYAKESIHIGVSRFLLKPVNRSELLTVVMDLKKQITDEQRKWFEYDHLKKILEKNQIILKERFLLEFLENSERTPLLQKQIEYYYKDKIPTSIQVTMLEVNSLSMTEFSEEERILQDMRLMEFVNAYLKKNHEIESVTDKDHHLILLSYNSSIKMSLLCEQIQHSIYQTAGLDISFGIGNLYSDFYKMSQSCTEALEALRYGRYEPNHPIVIYQNDLHLQEETWHLSQSQVDEVKFYVKAGLLEELKQYFSTLFMDEHGNLLDLNNARVLSMALMTAAIGVANEMGIDASEVFGTDTDSFLKMLLEPSSMELKMKTERFLMKLTSSISSLRANKSKTVLWDILQYVRNHMSESNLSLMAVAEEFHMNDSYLSRIFKKELGFSFSKYLNRLRMEQAIVYINTTDRKAYQIGEAVGIPDAYYFSNCFKKYTGQSIREYRKKNTDL